MVPKHECIPVSAKREKRFYEVVVVLKAFDAIRGDRIRRPERFSADEDHASQELRRSFIDSIAYACDSEKGGKTVTAAFLQQTPQGVVIWLAANRGLEPTTIQDITQLLSMASRNVDWEVTLEKMVQMNQPRLETYIKFVRRDLDRCVQSLQNGPAGIVAQFVLHLNYIVLISICV